MNVVTLHVLRSQHSADFGLLRLAAPALEPEARLVVFEGLPPAPVSPSPHLAPVVLQGDLDGHRVYAEQLFEGVLLSEIEPPPSLAAWIGSGLLAGLRALHQAGVIHGRVAGDRVQLGTDGSIVLFGRGRVGGSPAHDRLGAQEVLADLGMTMDPETDLESLHTRLRATSDPSDGQALAALVQAALPPVTVQSHAHVQIGPTPDSLDEVQPDLGPDESTSPGLLDRWAVTTHHDTDEHTAELTGSASGSSSPLTLTLWTALAAPPEHPPPADRFDAIQGEPSRGLRALLVAEPPDSLPGLASGRVQPFLLGMEEQSITDSGEDGFTEELTPADDDGDTAIYDLRERELLEAIRKADARTRIADLEARVSDAERRAIEAERRARAAEEAVGASRNPGLGAFLRVEVFVAVAIVVLMVWLAWRALG